MDPDQTAPLEAVWSGFLVLMPQVVWRAFEYMLQTVFSGHNDIII